MLGDGELDMSLSFDPANAASLIAAGRLPASVRTYTLPTGTIGNVSFVAIPFNAAHRPAAEVVADFLLEPATQARAQDIRVLGSFSVLDPARLGASEREAFARLPHSPALPDSASLGKARLEPHPSWMTRLTAAWAARYTQ